MDLIVLFRVLLKYKWLLLSVPLFAAFLAYFLTRGAQVEYKSTTQISTGFTLTDQVTITEGNFNLYEIDVKFSNLIETLKSPLVMSLLGYELLYHDLVSENPFKKVSDSDFEGNLFLQDIDFQKAPAMIKAKIDSNTLLTTYIQDERRLLKLLQLFKYDDKSLNEKISIDRVKRTDFISIEAVTNSAELSAHMVNELYNIYQRYTDSERAVRTVSSVRQFAALVNNKRDILNEKTEQLKEFKASNNLVNLRVESSATVEQLTELQAGLDEEEKKLRRINLEIQNFDNGEVQQNFNQSSEINNLELLQLRNRVNSLSSRYEQSGKTNNALRDSLEIARNRLQRLMISSSQNNADNIILQQNPSQSLRDLELQKQLATENITSLRNKIWSLRRSIGGFANYEVQVNALEDEIELASQEYLWAQEKYNQALDISTSSESSLRQVVKGQPATVAEPSKRVIISGLSGASSFMFCLILVLLLEYLDTSIKTPSNFARKVDLKLLASLNRVHLKNKKDKTASFGLLNFSKEKSKDTSIFNEQIRKLRFELNQHQGKIILFTSCRTGEGKTEMIISSASALSMRRKKILIIDTNFRNNSITNFYRAKPILGEPRLKQLRQGITNTKNKYVDVIGCKKLDYSPYEVLPDDFNEQVKELLSAYNFVFLEGPALNLHSDSRELSLLANGIITVFSAKSTVKQLDFESIEFLENQEKFIGSILNMVESSNIDL